MSTRPGSGAKGPEGRIASTARASDAPHKRIVAHEQHCMGCHLCEVWCAVAHSESKDIIRAFKKETTPLARLFIEEDRPISFALQCRHCEEAPCVAACISGAMAKDPATGLVSHDRDRCVGCWSCIMICPYGAIRQDTEGHVASKCDLCAGEAEPACVANCPNEALTWEDVE